MADDVMSIEDLHMGGRQQAQRIDGQIVHVTQLQVFRFEPEPVLYEVKHTAFIEFAVGQTMLVGFSTSLHSDIDEARKEFARVHLDPPSNIP